MSILNIKLRLVYCQKSQVFGKLLTVCRIFLFIGIFFDNYISRV
ncbi:hypothetical protein QE391_004565 [Pseudomonas fluorescens]|nr:hypothetical protein [Pseudomonas fluorescens]